MNWLALLGFGLAVLPICLTPGVSLTLVTERVLGTGLRAGAGVIAGTSFGLVTHALLAGAGLSALVMKSSTAFTVVKLVGAAYLIVIGVQAIWASRSAATRAASPKPRSLPWNGRGDIVQGYLGNVLNPKAAAVYLTIAPQFLDRDHALLPQIMLLCAVHVMVAAGWLFIWAGTVHLSRRAFQSPTLRTAMSRISGAVLIALGIRTALATR
ncbi:LysE family translocator [Kribbella sp. NPDC023855]|uniref:LysE family translocator n=1 Tax=Kribbella sp. NPDC023855 TaxID=3154698 RepID=UPI0033E73795